MNAARRLSKGKFGPRGKSLRALTDEELHDEQRTRRLARAPKQDETPAAKPGWRRVRQYFANLELDPGASAQEVERAYNRLLERYHPDKHREDPEKHRAAKELTDSLTHAYRSLRRYLAR